MLRALLRGLWVTAILLTASTAAAEPAARLVYLRGKGTESCPTDYEVQQAVATRLGYDPFSTYAPSTMFVEVASASPGFTASLKLVDAGNAVRGDRSLKVTGNCAELMDALALTISIAIDPMSITRSGPPPDAPPAEKPVDANLPSIASTSAEAPVAPDRPTEPPAPASDRSLAISLGPLVSVGSAPAASTGAALDVEGQLGWFLAGLEGRADLAASRETPLGRVSSSSAGGAVFSGVRFGLVSAAAVFSIANLSATSAEVARSTERSALMLATGGRVGVAVPLSASFEVRGRAEVLANLMQHELAISGQRAYAFPAVAANLGIAAAVRFR